MWTYFSSENLCTLSKGPSLSLPSAESLVYGTNSVHLKDTLIWNNPPYFIKSSASVSELKKNYKKV